MSTKILPVIIPKLSLKLYTAKVLMKQAISPPLLNWSTLSKSKTSTSNSIYKIISRSHGIIMRKGIICEKIPWYMWDSACRWCIDENEKVFWSYVKRFWNLPRERNTESWLVNEKKFSSIFQSCLLT